MPMAGPGRIDDPRRGMMGEHRFGHGGTTDVTKADHKNAHARDCVEHMPRAMN